jgi:hypothetical protein
MKYFCLHETVPTDTTMRKLKNSNSVRCLDNEENVLYY